MNVLGLPRSTGRSFCLGANFAPNDDTGDREALSENGWKLVDPEIVAATPRDYAEFIASSRAEISCPKPIYKELRTGWLSERSACYMAMGRPVLAEDTGFSELLPTGSGLVPFNDVARGAQGRAP